MPVVRGVEVGCHGSMLADPTVGVECGEDMFGYHGDE